MKIYWAGAPTAVDDYLIENHSNRLVTFAYPRDVKNYLDRIVRINSEKDQNIIIDSGAFSVWNKNEKIELTDYIQFLLDIKKKYSGYFKSMRFVTLDIIPGEKNKTPTKEQRENAAKKGMVNLHQMLKIFRASDLIHVFHMYEDFNYMDKILDYIDYIGISPANDATRASKKRWLTDVFDYLPLVKTHGFAVTALELIREFPFYSVDSTSFKLSAGMGSIMTKWGVFNISIESGKSALNAGAAIKQELQKYIKKSGINEYDLYTSDQARYLFNAKYMIDLQNSLNENGKGNIKKYIRKQLALF